MGITWVQVVQIFISLSILIVLHEFGHFAAARIFKTRVEKFYLFFDFLFPLATVFNFALFKKKIGDTEYGLGWFPLGGYVKIAGMVDESMDKEQMKLPPQPWEYRAKPAWQRLIIIMGGILVNFFLAMFLYIVLMGVWGEEYLPTENATYGISIDSSLYKVGLRNGDKIKLVNGKKVENFSKISVEILLSSPAVLDIDRNGQAMQITVPDSFVRDAISQRAKGIISVRAPFFIGKIRKPETEKAGLKPGDQVIGVNDSSILFVDQFVPLVQKNAGKQITIKVLRDKKDTLAYAVTVPADSLLGLELNSGVKEFLTLKKIDYSFWEAFPAGINKTFSLLGSYITQFKLFSPKYGGAKQIGGFGTMAKIFPENFTLEGFITITAFISLILAFMNFLPIPMLDGGYVVFILYEMITGKQPSDRFMEVTNYIGMIFLFGLMLYANGMDVYRGIFE
jgi:regulator of sigma E protease